MTKRRQLVFGSGFTFFLRRVAKGSRLRLLFACSNTFQLEKNYNSGHDAQDASYREIPVV